MTTKEYNNCVEQLSNAIYRFALKCLGNQEGAKDLVQHGFTVLWEKREEVAAAKAKSFLFTIVYRKNIDDFRKNEKQVLTAVLPEKPVPDQRQQVLKKVIDDALLQLDVTHRNLVLLKDVEGYSYDEIATITGLSLSQVKVYLFRARKTLQEILKVYKYHN